VNQKEKSTRRNTPEKILKEKLRDKKYNNDNSEKQILRYKKYRDENKEKMAEYRAVYVTNYPEKIAATQKKYRENNVDSLKKNREENKVKLTAYRKLHYLINRERDLIQMLEYRNNNREKINKRNAVYQKENKDRVNERKAKRRALKINAYVSWADRKKIAAFYAESKRLTILTGVPHHVDHIIPLQSKVICGLHNEFNLQVLTAHENQSKSNKFTPE